MVKPWFSQVRHLRAQMKIDEKHIRKHFLSESRNRSPAKGAFCDFGGLKTVPKSSPGHVGRPLGMFLGDLGSLLGDSWAALGALLDALGRSGDALGGLLDDSKSPLGGSLTYHGARTSILLSPKGDFDLSEGRFSTLQRSFGFDESLLVTCFFSSSPSRL